MKNAAGVAVRYSPEQQRIIAHRGGHLQVVACAGSGKTETVSMRVATLVCEGAEPASIIAFTFTNAAAAALKTRILRKVHEVDPAYEMDRLSPMFVGTLHSFCLRFLQERAPRYAAFDLFEDHRLVGLLSREYFNLGLNDLGYPRGTEAISTFLDTAAVVDNERIDPDRLPRGRFREVYAKYLDLLVRYHVLTHDQCIARAVSELERPEVFAAYHPRLRHLIVDEFQDINPAQARLIELLGARPVHVCVVGDDDQAIYQWRGSSVEYIRDFKKNFRARREELALNRRSRKTIVDLAAAFASTIPQRLPKQISAKREADPKAVQRFLASTAEREADLVADAIARMHGHGIAYRDLSILLRSVKTSGQTFLDALDRKDVPYTCAGRTGLFLQPEALLFGRLFFFLAGRGDFWDARTRAAFPVDIDSLLPELQRLFSFPKGRLPTIRAHLEAWRRAIPRAREADLVGSFYRLLRLLQVHLWDIEDRDSANRLGVLARFSQLLADFESVTRRARRVHEPGKPVEMRGGLSGKEQYFERLANYIGYYAQTAYDDFAGEPDFDQDAVTVTTVHQAKGLEWPVVFVPCLSARRFPSAKTGAERDWLIPRSEFPAERYEGSDEDERRLFYVAMTRARDVLYLSTHERVTTQRVQPSPYFLDAGGSGVPVADDPLWVPRSLPPRPPDDDDKPTYTFSELAAYQSCPLSFRFRTGLGLQPPVAKEIGYGKAVHHVLRRVADLVKERGTLPSASAVEAIFEREFYLPHADRPAYQEMRRRAAALVGQYLTDFADDLERVWEVERPFELHLPEANIAGRADVILDREDGQVGALALVDYKTKTDADQDPVHALQLAVYTAAARGEGFEVRAAYLHDLAAPKAEARKSVPVGKPEVAKARKEASELAGGIRGRQFTARVGPHCARCDVRWVCKHGPAR